MLGPNGVCYRGVPLYVIVSIELVTSCGPWINHPGLSPSAFATASDQKPKAGRQEGLGMRLHCERNNIIQVVKNWTLGRPKNKTAGRNMETTDCDC